MCAFCCSITLQNYKTWQVFDQGHDCLLSTCARSRSMFVHRKAEPDMFRRQPPRPPSPSGAKSGHFGLSAGEFLDRCCDVISSTCSRGHGCWLGRKGYMIDVSNGFLSFTTRSYLMWKLCLKTRLVHFSEKIALRSHNYSLECNIWNVIICKTKTWICDFQNKLPN